MNKFNVMALIVVLHAVSAHGATTWQRLLDYGEGKVVAIQPAPSLATTYYALHSTQGLYKSANSGLTWSVDGEGLPELGLTTMAIDPQQANTVWVVDFGTVYRTIDGGATWTSVTDGLTSNNITDIAVSPHSSTDVVLTTVDGKIWILDGSNIWQNYENYRCGVDVSPMDIDFLPVTTTSFVVTCANNKTMTVPLVPGPTTVTHATPISGRQLAIDSSNESIWYLASDSDIEKSTNGGTDWVSVKADVPTAFTTDLYWVGARLCAHDKTSKALYYTDNGGSSWETISLAPFGAVNHGDIDASVMTSDFIPMFSDSLFGIYRLGGALWENVLVIPKPSVATTSISQDKHSIKVRIGTSGRGAVEGSANDYPWASLNGMTPSVTVTAIDNDGQTASIMFAGRSDEKLYKTTNGGLTWSEVAGFTSCGMIRVIKRDDTDVANAGDAVWFVACATGLFRSADAGVTWERVIATNNVSHYVTDLLQDASDPTHWLAVIYGKGLYKGINGGAPGQWSQALLPTSITLTSIAQDPSNSNRFLLSSEAGLYLSTDGGSEWNAVASTSAKSIRSVVIRPVHPDTWIIALAPNGVEITENAGGSWSTFETDLLTNEKNVNKLHFNTGKAYDLLAATQGGTTLYRFVPVCGDGILELPTESCDDSNAVSNDGCSSTCQNEIDSDGDGFFVSVDDCNDSNSGVHPGAAEICTDGTDQDCDGFAACDDSDCSLTAACQVCGNGTVEAGEECDDSNVTALDGCSASCKNETDADSDGSYVEGGDCNDTSAAINPSASELCSDTIDNNCDGVIDCNDSNCSANPACVTAAPAQEEEASGDDGATPGSNTGETTPSSSAATGGSGGCQLVPMSSGSVSGLLILASLMPLVYTRRRLY